jgi:hypothetical protein
MPIVTTLIVFVVVLVGVAAIGFRFVQSSSKRSGRVPASPGGLSMPVSGVAPPPGWGSSTPVPVSPTMHPVHLEGGVFCPRCAVRSASDYCTGCGFDLRTLIPQTFDPQAFNPYQSTANPYQPTANPYQPTANPYQPTPVAPAAPAKKRRQNGIWPNITDAVSARFAAKQGMGAALFCSGTTLAFVYLAHQGVAMVQGLNETALVDAAVFAVLGFAILRMSRVAAAAALVLYIIERFAMWRSVTGVGGASIPMMAVILLCFISGVRGTLAYHRYNDPRYSDPARL